MSSKQKVFIVIGMIVIIGVSFVVGLFIGQQNAPKNDLAIRKVVGQTFYANIESIKQYNDGSFHINVKGLEINDINYRGNFTFKLLFIYFISCTWSVSDFNQNTIFN